MLKKVLHVVLKQGFKPFGPLGKEDFSFNAVITAHAIVTYYNPVSGVVGNGDRLDELGEEVKQLKEDVSFNAVITAHTVINDNPVVFDVVRHNNGQGYNSSTGNVYLSMLVN